MFNYMMNHQLMVVLVLLLLFLLLPYKLNYTTFGQRVTGMLHGHVGRGYFLAFFWFANNFSADENSSYVIGYNLYSV